MVVGLVLIQHLIERLNNRRRIASPEVYPAQLALYVVNKSHSGTVDGRPWTRQAYRLVQACRPKGSNRRKSTLVFGYIFYMFY